jgi:hypothetical protein
VEVVDELKKVAVEIICAKSTPYGTDIFNGSLDNVTYAWRGRKNTGASVRRKKRT